MSPIPAKAFCDTTNGKVYVTPGPTLSPFGMKATWATCYIFISQRAQSPTEH